VCGGEHEVSRGRTDRPPTEDPQLRIHDASPTPPVPVRVGASPIHACGVPEVLR